MIKKHPLNVQTLQEIKSTANRYFFNMSKPVDAEGGDFLTLCYVMAVGDYLAQQGGLDRFQFVGDRTFQEPIDE